MTGMTTTGGPVTGGVDTHGQIHHAAVIDQVGRRLRGAALARHLGAESVVVPEVDRPDLRARRAKAKSGPPDAYAAARAVLSGPASSNPEAATGGSRRSGRCAWCGAARSRLGPRR